MTWRHALQHPPSLLKVIVGSSSLLLCPCRTWLLYLFFNRPKFKKHTGFVLKSTGLICWAEPQDVVGAWENPPSATGITVFYN
jgi:hypothetical protein